MKIILSHTSALEYWRSVSSYKRARPSPSRGTMPGDKISSSNYTEELRRLVDECCLSEPIHLLAKSKQNPFSCKEFTYHVRSELLPTGSLAKISDGIFIVSTELCLMQMASTVSLSELVALGYEMSGTYSLPSDQTAKFNCRELTAPGKMELYISKAHRVYGVKKLRSALPHIIPKSASPMETALTMLLCLPYRYGGFCLPQPQLNYNICPVTHEQRYTTQSYYSCDLYWQDCRLAVEYDSNLFHTGAERIARDSIRRDELTALGVTIVTVTTHQIMNQEGLDQPARLIAKKLGKQIRLPENFRERQLSLYRMLFDNSR